MTARPAVMVISRNDHVRRTRLGVLAAAAQSLSHHTLSIQSGTVASALTHGLELYAGHVRES